MESKLSDFRTIPRACTLILHASPSETKKKESTRVGPTDNFEQSKEKNYPPTSLVTLLCIFCVLGRAHSCALCAPSGRRGESRRAGDGNPALLLLCSNRPQQPARQRRVAIFLHTVKHEGHCGRRSPPPRRHGGSSLLDEAISSYPHERGAHGFPCVARR